jgi:hypothetical protein
MFHLTLAVFLKKTPYRWQGSRDFMLGKPATQPYTLRFIEQAFSLKLLEEQTRPSDKIVVSVAAHLNVTRRSSSNKKQI